MIRLSTYLKQYKYVATATNWGSRDVMANFLLGLATSSISRSTVLSRRGKRRPFSHSCDYCDCENLRDAEYVGVLKHWNFERGGAHPNGRFTTKTLAKVYTDET